MAQLAATATPVTLTDVISQTISSNPSALAASEKLKQSTAELRGAKAMRHVQLTFNSATSVSNATVIQPPPSGETFAGQVDTLTVPVPLGAKNDLVVSESEAQLSSADAAYQASLIAIATQAAAAYYDYLKKQALEQAAQSALDLSSRELSDAQSRNQAGDIPELDVEQAEVPVASDRAALLEAQSAESSSLEVLNDLLCRPLDSPITLSDISQATPAPAYSIDDARVMALAASADLAASTAAMRADQAALNAAKRFADPSLSLQAIDLRSGDQTSFSREDTLQASLTVPIDDGGVGASGVDAAQSVLNQAVLTAQETKKTVVLDVSTAYLAVKNSAAEVASAKSAYDTAEATFEKTRIGYADGLYPLVDTLTAESADQLAQSTYIQALYSAAYSRFVLDIAVNGIAALGSLELKSY